MAGPLPAGLTLPRRSLRHIIRGGRWGRAALFPGWHVDSRTIPRSLRFLVVLWADCGRAPQPVNRAKLVASRWDGKDIHDMLADLLT